MKKLRCPNCGQKTLGWSNRWYALGLQEDQIKFREKYGRFYYRRRSSYGSCPECNCALAYIAPGSFFKESVLMYAIILLDIALCVATLITRDMLWCIIGLCIITAGFLYFVCKQIWITATHHMLKYVGDEGIERPKPNIRAKIDYTKYIKPYGVYGLKFNEGKITEKYKEAFPDGLVPATFLPDKNGDCEFEIYLFNKNVLNEDMLFAGAEFSVEDYDGIFITKGKVSKINLEW